MPNCFWGHDKKYHEEYFVGRGGYLVKKSYSRCRKCGKRFSVSYEPADTLSDSVPNDLTKYCAV